MFFVLTTVNLLLPHPVYEIDVYYYTSVFYLYFTSCPSPFTSQMMIAFHFLTVSIPKMLVDIPWVLSEVLSNLSSHLINNSLVVIFVCLYIAVYFILLFTWKSFFHFEGEIQLLYAQVQDRVINFMSFKSWSHFHNVYWYFQALNISKHR